MQMPVIKSTPNVIKNNVDISVFKGLSRLPIIDKGELRSMTNLCSDYPNCLSPRPSREVYETLSYGSALFAVSNGKLCWVDGTDFLYDGVIKGTVQSTPKSIVEFGPYILIFPDKIYYNYSDDTFGDIGSGAYPNNVDSCPDVKYACVFNNRVWGVGGQGLYASKFKDPFTWAQFSSPLSEMDSVYFELDNCNGELTGIIPLENHIVVTTTKAIYELYGTKPSDFSPRLISTSSGCVNNKTLAEIDNRVYMLSRDGINIYGGSYPQPLSLQLQEKNCVSGTAIGFNRKYYISLYNGSSYSLYVYDTLLQQWHREDDLNVLDFAVSGNNLYALADNGRIYKFNSGTETVSWEAETDRFTEQYLGYKATSKIKIEAELELDSSFSVYVRTDGSEYMRVGTDTTSGYHYFAAYELPRNTFWFQIKLVGSGKCKLYSITREIIVGSDLI